MRILKCVLVIITTLVFAFSSYAQSTKQKKTLRDSLDNKLDYSDFLLNPIKDCIFLQFETLPDFVE
ncbi:hypothetical protein [Xanthomarina gelatinilytica]|uniref:hypothetical protein n=1 Tax=Xanthomarina gelatinilytica TaxID=1137281 RepID=UPI003AA9533E